jgi:hypothetical protein
MLKLNELKVVEMGMREREREKVSWMKYNKIRMEVDI